MLEKISCQNKAASIRKIIKGKDQPRTIVTLGNCSYLAQANLDYELYDFCHVLIGNYCSLAHRITFEIGTNHNYHKVSSYPFNVLTHPEISPMNMPPNKQNKYQILIGNDVWIGCNVMLFGGVRVGNGAVIAANSVVTKDVPPYAIAAGIPAKVIKYRFPKEIIHKLQKIKWWNWPTEKILTNLELMDSPKRFVEQFYTAKENEPTTSSKLVHQLKHWKQTGYKIFYFIPDFYAKGELWPEVLRQFVIKFHKQDLTVLVLSVDHTPQNNNKIQELTQLAQANGSQSSLVIIVNTTAEQASLDILSNADYFITSRESTSSWGIDYADSYDVKILSGLSADIFG